MPIFLFIIKEKFVGPLLMQSLSIPGVADVMHLSLYIVQSIMDILYILSVVEGRANNPNRNFFGIYTTQPLVEPP